MPHQSVVPLARLLPLALVLPLATACGGAAGAEGSDTVTVTVGYQSKTINTVTAGTLLRSLSYFEDALAALGREERRGVADRWLERVGLAEHARKLPRKLSGGQRQRVQLARALAGQPRAVLMDEPFGALDPHTRAGMQDLLVDILRGTGATVVFVTHDVDEALHLGDRITLLSSGEVLDVPHPRQPDARNAPATTGLRRRILTSL